MGGTCLCVPSGTWRLLATALLLTGAVVSANNGNDSYPVLKEAPLLVDATNTTLKFRLPSLAHSGLGQPRRLKLQYKEETDKQTEWKDALDEDIDNRKELTVTIKELSAGHTYRVRGVLVATDGVMNTGAGVPSTLANTSCVAPRIVNTIAGRRDIRVTFQEWSALNCPWKWFHLAAVNATRLGAVGKRMDTFGYEKTVKLAPLQPHTMYLVELTRDGNLTDGAEVTTGEDAPAAVHKLKITERTPTAIGLQWSPPREPNGVITNYRIHYQHINYRGCAVPRHNATSKGTKWTKRWYILLEGLVPYSEYNITVWAKTIDYGVNVTIKGMTNETDVPMNRPTLASFFDSDTSFTVHWKMDDCSALRGPLWHYLLVTRGASPWNRDRLYNETFQGNDATVRRLEPFSDYTISAYIKRPTGRFNDSLPLVVNFTTEAAGPPPVRNLTVYSHGPGWLSLRWREPYPPRGVLQGHREQHYSGNSSRGVETDVTGVTAPCVLWPDMTCHSIRGADLVENKTYTVKIVAYNRVNLTGEWATRAATTVEGVSSPPLGLALSGVTAHNMTITWQHPWVPAGELRGFRVAVSATGHNQSSQYHVPLDGLLDTYSYTLQDISFGTEYNVTVWGFSSVEGEPATLLIRLPGPAAPWWQHWWWWAGLALVSLVLILLLVSYVVKRCRSRRRRKLRLSTEQICLNSPGAAVGNEYQLDDAVLAELKSRQRPDQSGAKADVTDGKRESLAPVLTYRVSLHKLDDYVARSLETGELRRQHAIFPAVPTELCLHGKLPQNVNKNRKERVVAYDATRVVLKKLPDDPSSDYINANYVDGYKAPRFYIATQGPKPNTVADFWRMVWQERVQVICMLANVVENGEIASEHYWPDLDKEVTHGAVTVTTACLQVFADYSYRRLLITHKHNRRLVQHWHFTAWPARSLPLHPHSVARFLRRMLSASAEAGPIVMHCSDGVGRTGAAILASINLQMAVTEQAVDVLHFQQAIRKQRPNMVDTEELYRFVHLVLVECLVEGQTELPCDSEYAARVRELSASGETGRQFSWLNRPRFQRRGTPGTPGRSRGQKEPGFVSVNGFRVKDHFLCSRFPQTEDVGDFWKTVLKRNAALVVVLNDEDGKGARFVPKTDQTLRISSRANVSLSKMADTEHCTIKYLDISKQGKAKKESVRLLQFKGWPGEHSLPHSADNLLMLLHEVERLYMGDGPVVVTCMDGATACGLFLALAFVVEMVKLEQVCDVCLAVRSVRRSCDKFVAAQDQFEFLYQAVAYCLEEFQTYANFN